MKIFSSGVGVSDAEEWAGAAESAIVVDEGFLTGLLVVDLVLGAIRGSQMNSLSIRASRRLWDYDLL
jgi:hypothetical protein